MTEEEYLLKTSKVENDEEVSKRLVGLFNEIYPKFSKWSYSEIEWFVEHIKRTTAKESFCLAQLWQGKTPTI